MNKLGFDIIEQAFTHLKVELGDKLTWAKVPSYAENHDAFFTVAGKQIVLEVKNEVRPSHLHQLRQLKTKSREVLVAANYITPSAKKLLREANLNYVDRVGNIWFRLEPIHIYIEGIHNQAPSEDRKNRAFSKTGTKVVFHLLDNPELINQTYRDIAKISNVSLGTIPKVINGLKEEGYLIKKTNKTWIIKDYEALLHRWQEEYTRRLKPTLFFSKYKAVDSGFHSDWKKIELKNGGQWGGEPAADLLTNYLKPEEFTLYTNESQQGLMANYRWVPDPEGDIYVYRKFWETEDKNFPKKYVSPLIIYADLMETGDPRSMETASMIYEKHLQ